jgi:DnaK suppressor protein
MTRPVERGAAQGFGKRIGDGTVEAVSRLTEIGVGRSTETKRLKIERALQKLDEGTYGICDSCGQPIMPARLRAMPASAVCVPCADRAPRAPSPRR